MTRKKAGRIGNVISQYTKDGAFVKVWESSTAAANELNIHKSGISGALTGRLNTSAGFKWELGDHTPTAPTTQNLEVIKSKSIRRKNSVNKNTKLAIVSYVTKYWDPTKAEGLNKNLDQRRKWAKKISNKFGTPEATVYMCVNYMTNLSTEMVGRVVPSTTMVAHGHKGPLWCRNFARVLIEEGLVK